MRRLPTAEKLGEGEGHERIQMTCRYARLAPAHQLAAVDRLEERVSPLRNGVITLQSKVSAAKLKGKN